MTVLFMYNFRSLSNKFTTIFRIVIFHLTPKVNLFFVEKRKPEILGFRNVMDRGIRKILIIVIRQIV